MILRTDGLGLMFLFGVIFLRMPLLSLPVSRLRSVAMLYGKAFLFSQNVVLTTSGPNVDRAAITFYGTYMTLDFEKYRHYVDHFDISEEDKRALAESIWKIMESFVDQAFGLHPIQQCEERTKTILQDSSDILDSNISEEGSEQ